MKKLVLVMLLFPTIALAQPQIGFVHGVVTDQEIVTITGSGFGTKSPAAPLKWDTFDSGVSGTPLATNQPEWVAYAYDGSLYTDVTAHSGNLSVMNNTDRPEFATNYLDLPPTEKLYISYWFNTRDADTDDYGIIKLCRINSSAAAGGGGRYNGVGETFLSNMNPAGMNSPYFSYDNGEGSARIGYVKVSFNEWSRVDMYKELSTPGQPDGSAFCQNIEEQRVAEQHSIITRAAGFDFQLDTVLLGLMMANAQGTYSLYLDDIYIDNTLARIELGNNEEFSACTHREMQIPSAWNSQGDAIEIQINAGTFSPGEEAWLFVIDSEGNASNGFPVTMSQSVNSPGVPGIPVRN